MDWSDPPAGTPASFSPPPAWAGSAAPTPAPPAALPSPTLGGARRLVATAVLAVGLLGVGGAAVVFAADPSASPAPSAGTQTPPGTSGGGSVAPTTPGNGGAPKGTGHAKGDCPNMGGSGGTAPGAPAAPSTNGSTSSPSTSDL
jgi:hypothetical protein